MRIFFRTVPLAAINLLQSLNAGRAFNAVFSTLLKVLTYVFLLFMYLLKPVFLWPLMFFSAVLTLLTVAVPVLLLANPLFTLGNAYSGLLKIIDQFPAMWPVFILLSLQIDMLLFLRREYNQEFGRVWGRLCNSDRGQASGSDLTCKQGN